LQLLYEEDGELKVGTVLAQAPASYQVESPHGRRTKVKAGSVLLSFEDPPAAQLLPKAEEYSRSLDSDFLWQCASGEFHFADLAREYVGREPSAVESAGVLVKLHSAPMYFHRRGRGRFQAAPAETLRLALAGVERKKRLQEQAERWTATLREFRCPPEIAALKDELLYGPDRNKPETRAFEEACRATGLTPARLFERCGLLPDSQDYHLKRFLHEFFPRGAGFPPHGAVPAAASLPLAECPAFSLDDVGTTEIDDAFSLVRLSGGEWRVGIHIAAPATGIAPGSALDAIARERLSTAYMPGRKFTMLPDDAVARFSLDHGAAQPAMSLYFQVSEEDPEPRGLITRLERVPIAANLRHAEYDVLNDALEERREVGLPYEHELRTLWRVALGLEKRRGRASTQGSFIDYSFYVEGDRVRIAPRKRGSPLDKLVSEFMILVNSRWGELLAERDVAAIYRVQSTGKVRFSVHAEPHDGLGVACYAWTSSPLRRYVDLVNQWQLAAALQGGRPPFTRNSDALLSAMRAFEVTYARYDEHQRAMEMYWSLRWLIQEDRREIAATVLRENVVRCDGVPLVLRVPSLPAVPPGARVQLSIDAIDLLERTLTCTYRATLPGVEEGVAAAEASEKA